MNLQLMIEVLEDIEQKLEESDQVSLAETIYENKEELLDDINDFIVELEDGNEDAIEYIDIHFLTNATFEVIAKNQNWTNEFQIWSSKYEAAKQ
jgi:hypothetical protein